MKKVGFTTSIPVEIIFSSGNIPVDLNNIFITSKNPKEYLDKAEEDGFPRGTCAWIKGIYSAMCLSNEIDALITVIEGDCSNTKALSEVLEHKGIECIPFSYPTNREHNKLQHEVEALLNTFNVDLKDCIKTKQDLDRIRQKLVLVDELTWRDNKITGFENHLWQVSSSDFEGDYLSFEEKLDNFLDKAIQRSEFKQTVRLGYIGVPPIIGDLYDFIEQHDARVVFNEVQRQFTMFNSIHNDDLIEVYRLFTYPYRLEHRLVDIKKQIKERKLDGIIHYTQSFCFRNIEDIIIRKELDVPILTLEGDRPELLDARNKLRIESFIDMLK